MSLLRLAAPLAFVLAVAEPLTQNGFRTGLMKQRLERSKELRAQLETEEADLRLYDLLAGDLRSDKFQAYVLHEVFTELVQGAFPMKPANRRWRVARTCRCTAQPRTP